MQVVKFNNATIKFIDTTFDVVSEMFPTAVNDMASDYFLSDCFLSVEDGKLIMSFKKSSPLVWDGEKWVEYE